MAKVEAALRAVDPAWRGPARPELEPAYVSELSAAGKTPLLKDRVANLLELARRYEGDKQAQAHIWAEIYQVTIHPLFEDEAMKREAITRLARLDLGTDADLHNLVAWKLAEAGQELELAAKLAEEAVRLFNAQTFDAATIILSFDDWQQEHLMLLAGAIDTRGYVALKGGDLPKAIDDFRLATSLSSVPYGYTEYHLYQAFSEAGRSDEAFESLVRAVIHGLDEGEDTSQARATLETQLKARFGHWVDLNSFLEDEKQRMGKSKAEPESSPGVDNASSSLIGTVAPPFEVKLLTGETVRSEALKGQIIVISFWATWCKPCLEEFPILEALHEKYRAQGVQFLAMSTDEDEKTVREFLKKSGVHLPIAMSDSALAESFHAGALPTLVLIDKQGKVALHTVGYDEEAGKKIEAAIGQLK